MIFYHYWFADPVAPKVSPSKDPTYNVILKLCFSHRPVEQQYSQPLVPLPLEESDSPENWKPFKDPVAKLSEAMKLVGDQDWCV